MTRHALSTATSRTACRKGPAVCDPHSLQALEVGLQVFHHHHHCHTQPQPHCTAV
jgi:hypothetical protein